MKLLLNMFGADRPGLTADLTEVLYRHNANLGDASMTRIGGNFALIMMVEIESDQREMVETDLDVFAENHPVYLSTASASGLETEWGDEQPNSLITLYGADRPGIVYRVCRELGDRGINICDLRSSQEETENLYIMVIEVHRPDSVELTELQEIMADLTEELGVTIQVRDLPTMNL